MRRAVLTPEQLLAAERRLIPAPDLADRAVAVCYPNHYWIGMSNLGLHRLLELVGEQPGWAALRAFLPEVAADSGRRGRRGQLTTLDGDVPLHRADLVAVTLSYEEDYGHVRGMLEAGGVPGWRRDRGADDPLVLLGGFAPTLNPEPVAALADVLLLGPAEASLPALLDRCARLLDAGGGRRPDRDALADALEGLPGLYLPGPNPPIGPVRVPVRSPRWDPDEEGALRTDLAATGRPPRTRILTPNTEFADRFLIAVGEGCPHGCRFCAAGFARRPPLAYPAEVLRRAVDEGLAAGVEPPRIGLMGAAVTDLPCLDELAARVAAAGGDVSTSSLRIGSLGAVQGQGPARPERRALTRTATLAPEAGTAPLRTAVNKPLTDDEILETIAACGEGGAHRVRLYLLVGLPGEDDDHARAIVELARRAREALVAAGRDRGRVAELVLSVNPFVPKADTPLQWAPMAEPATLSRRLALIRAGLRRLGGVQLRTGGERLALRQAILSLGGRETSEVLELAPGRPGWWQALRRWHDDHGAFAFAERDRDHAFPWQFVDRGVDRAFLWREWGRYRSGKATPSCDVARCTACGACG